MLDGSVPMGLGDSLTLSGIGMLVVFMELCILALLIMFLSKVMASIAGKGKKEVSPAAPAAPAPVSAPAAVAAPAPVAAPALTLTDVSEPAAAAIMAIVSDKTGIPLNRLAFRSIKGRIEIEGATDEEAAVIMALTADKIGVSPDRLVFKSIKKI